MRDFLLKIVFISSLLVVFVTTLFYITKYTVLNTFSFVLPPNVNVLIVGDSHCEAAIDDGVISNSKNIAFSGDDFFCSFLKAREFIETNPQLDTLILGCSYGELFKYANPKTVSEAVFKHHIKTYAFLYRKNDFKSMLNRTTGNTLKYIPQSISFNVKTILKKDLKIGGFVSFKRFKLQEAIIRNANQLKDNSNSITEKVSKSQVQYLTEIYKLCLINDVKLILLNVPIHPIEKNQNQKYKSELLEKLSKSYPLYTYIDHSGFTVKDSAYADLDHLNYIGSKIYSEFLSKNGFIEL